MIHFNITFITKLLNINYYEGDTMKLNKKQLDLCTQKKWDFSDLRAVFLNCTLKKSPEMSHTEGLITISKEIMKKNGVKVETFRPVDYDIAYGVWGDMKKHG